MENRPEQVALHGSVHTGDITVTMTDATDGDSNQTSRDPDSQQPSDADANAQPPSNMQSTSEATVPPAMTDNASPPSASTVASVTAAPQLHVRTDSGLGSPASVIPVVPISSSPTSSPSPSPSVASPPSSSSSILPPLPASCPPLFLDSSSTFRSCPRLVDYFLVLGRINDSDTPLQPMRKMSRSNSQTIQPISDVTVVSNDKMRDLPIDHTPITDFSGKHMDVNPGLLRTPVFLAECRVPKRRGSAVTLPITSLDVINTHTKEVPRPGFIPVSGNLQRGSLSRSMQLCVERDPGKSPLIDIRIVWVPGGVNALAAAAKYITQTQGPVAANAHPLPIPAHISNPFTSIIPPEYIRVDTPCHRDKELFLCYKLAKRRAVEYSSYEPFLVDRYPEVDHDDFALESAGVSMLCFPRGMLLQTEQQLPNFMSFVLTQASGEEVYGAALIFYEEMPQDPQSIPMQAQEQRVLARRHD